VSRGGFDISETQPAHPRFVLTYLHDGDVQITDRRVSSFLIAVWASITPAPQALRTRLVAKVIVTAR
jgi:hypothetical protein